MSWWEFRGFWGILQRSQTVDVWMNNYGVADRNYVDPILFRSIAVEKGPSMTRGVKSGVGGSVAIQTIEPEDIVPEGKKWGIQIKGSFSGNTAKPRVDNLQYLGVEDYRTIPGRPTTEIFTAPSVMALLQVL